MQQTLPRSFFLPAPDVVARALLGKLLLRRWEGGWLAGRIVETEAYFGVDDPAAHAYAGRTPRNSVLFGPPGHAYVYFIYGLHACLNVSCEPNGVAGCVLLRALEPFEGLDEMARLRGLSKGASPRLLTSGPGRLCQALGITRERLNGVDLLDPAGELLLAEPEDGWVPGEIALTPRIGIRKAAERPLRFILAGNPYVSGARVRGVS
jgi:DNA-3-methyladenine glycosylase